MGADEEPRKITVCPDCDGTNIRPLVDADAAKGSYYCRECGEWFDEPTRREVKHEPRQPSGYAGKLAEADPDDVP